MEGTWYDPFGAIKRIRIEIPCCDNVNTAPGVPPPPCPPVETTVWGPCDGISGICSWGKTQPTYQFVSYNGSPQVSRLDAVYDDEGEKRSLVILRISPETLLVFMSVEFPTGGDERPFSTVQRFSKDENCRYWRGTVICRDPRLQNLVPTFPSE
jgi:hypothetical protein